jgi:hypothetical protein
VIMIAEDLVLRCQVLVQQSCGETRHTNPE